MAPPKMRYIVLLAASCLFYMAFVPYYILILLATIVVDYYAGIKIEESSGKARDKWLVFSIISTCAILFVFKYYNFFIDNVNFASKLVGSEFYIRAINILLPIGLSFHTFQSLSYVIEVYRGDQKAERHFGIYALYVMFYPQLVAGPIERPQNLLHQFHDKHNFDHKFNYEEVTSGLKLIAWGLFKKAVIADTLAIFVTPVFDKPAAYSGGVLATATLFFTFQIYCDFSGYSDMARGLARTMGFKLMVNFNFPYAATSMSMFWRRWHISLSTWLRDYVYDPLSFEWRHWGAFGITAALMATFLMSGIWHGAAWTFVAWGLLHGIALSLEAVSSKPRKFLTKAISPWIYNASAWILTFAFVNLSYIFFRSKTLSDAGLIVRRIAGWFHQIIDTPEIVLQFKPQLYSVVTPDQFSLCLKLIAFLVIVDWLIERFKIAEKFQRLAWWARWPIYQTAVLVIVFWGQWLGARNFIYFQF
jgi:D-alanyl-lipoteichoic acid acyltransferase DltB (MBOAT superfamily)